jgi:hypothetical protein
MKKFLFILLLRNIATSNIGSNTAALRACWPKSDFTLPRVVNSLPLDQEEENAALQEDARILALLNLTLRGCQHTVTGPARSESESANQIDCNEEEELVQLALRIERLALRRSHSAGGLDGQGVHGHSKAELLYQRGRALFSDKGQWRAAEVCLSRPVLLLGCSG